MEYMHFFEWLIMTSIKASALALVILILKSLVGYKIGAKWHYCIWFLLIARLILPVLPQTSFSIFNYISPSIQNTNGNVNVKDSNLNKDYLINKGELIEANEIEAIRNSEQTNIKKAFYWKEIAFFIWLIVFIILIVHVFIANYFYRKKMMLNSIVPSDDIMKVVYRLKEKLAINRAIRIVHSNVKSPELYGIVRPVIILPMAIEHKVSSKQLELILLHEMVHFRRNDVYIVLLIKVLQLIHWFNPFLWYTLNKVRYDNEIACDALTLSYIDDDDIIHYGNTILALIQHSLHPKNVIVTQLACNKKNVKRRIIMISKYNLFSSKLRIIGAALLLIITLLFLTNGQEKAAEVNSDKDITTSTLTDSKTNKAEEQYSDVDSDNADLVQVNSDADSEAGINDSDEEDDGEKLWPLPIEGRITSPFGERYHPILKTSKMHNGVDIAAPLKTDILSTEKGTVIFSGFDEEYGNLIEIQHDDGLVTKYGHCYKLLKSKGDDVVKGDIIAQVGVTGKSTGPHLHFGVAVNGEFIDPIKDYFSK